MAATSRASTSARPSPRSAETARTSPAAASARASSRRAPSRGPSTRSILLSTTTAGQAGGGDRLRDVAVAGAERLGRVQQHQRRVHLPSASSTVVCMRRVSESNGFWNPGKVQEHDLAVVQRDDPGDAPPRGLGMVADDADLAPHERVDQRRLADVGAPEDGDEAAAELLSHRRLPAGAPPASGSANGAVSSSRRCATRSSPPARATISGSPNSASACRQKPHGRQSEPSRAATAT